MRAKTCIEGSNPSVSARHGSPRSGAFLFGAEAARDENPARGFGGGRGEAEPGTTPRCVTPGVLQEANGEKGTRSSARGGWLGVFLGRRESCKCRQALPQGSFDFWRKVGVQGRMRLTPELDRRPHHGNAISCDPRSPRSAIERVTLDREQSATLQHSDGCRQGRGLHRHQCGHSSHRGRFRLVQGHQQRELLIGESQRLERMVEVPRQSSRSPLRRQAQAGVAHVKHGLARQELDSSLLHHDSSISKCMPDFTPWQRCHQ